MLQKILHWLLVIMNMLNFGTTHITTTKYLLSLKITYDFINLKYFIYRSRKRYKL